MRILLYEHYAAGHEAADAIERAQVAVNRALLAALAVDLGQLGGHEVRLVSGWPTPTLAEDRAWAEAVILLAPESDDCLAELADDFEQAGLRLLGSTAAATRLVSDKLGLTLALGEAGLAVPRSWAIGFEREDQLARIVGGLGWPLVVKPLAGAGGRGARLVRVAEELPTALAALRAATSFDSFLLQEYIAGQPAGVGLVVAGEQVRALGLWGSLLSEPPALVVERCATPFDHPDIPAALAAAGRAARTVPGLAGYIEVDLILSQRGPVLLELGTRPTLGTLALRRSQRLNLAELILDACLSGRLPRRRLPMADWPVLVDLAEPGTALAASQPG
jgi:predicted ATP-grasp superfamily ATP-dependent carboligase